VEDYLLQQFDLSHLKQLEMPKKKKLTPVESKMLEKR
jgi:hypothetical protein